MQGTWIDANVADDLYPGQKKVPARAFVRDCVLRHMTKRDMSGIGVVYKSDFIYIKDGQKILKNREGSVETLYDNARRYSSLKNHPNENVRKALEKVETLAALSEE